MEVRRWKKPIILVNAVISLRSAVQSGSNYSVMPETSAELRFQEGNMKFSKQNEEWCVID